MPCRVPPKWEAICLVHLNGVSKAHDHATDICGVVSRRAPDVVELQLIRNRNVDALKRSQVEGRADGRALGARAVVAADVDDEGIVEFAHVIHGLDDPTDLMVGIGDIGAEHLGLAGEELLLIGGERVPLR